MLNTPSDDYLPFLTLIEQTQAACGLAKRRAYPPGPNPWKYAPVERTDPDFNMYTSLFTLILLGALLGKMIAKVPKQTTDQIETEPVHANRRQPTANSHAH